MIIELYQHSPFTWWVSYRDGLDSGPRRDVYMNLHEAEAITAAQRRRQLTGNTIYLRRNTSYPLYYKGPFRNTRNI